MKVLHLISSSSFFGAERVVVELCKYMAAMEVVPIVGLFFRDKETLEDFSRELQGTPVTLISFDGKKLISYKNISQVNELIDHHQIDIVHSHGYKSDIYAFWTKFLFRKKVGLIATNHNWLYENIKDSFYMYADAIHLRFFDSVVSVSDDLKKKMIRLGVPARKIDMIANGVDVKDRHFAADREDARRELGISQSDFVVGCVARMTPEKAHLKLLQGFARFSSRVENSCKLVLVGDGPLKKELISAVRDLKITHQVIFTGKREDARSLYAAFNVFALVSITEGLPMALLEAMSARIPVIVSNVGSMPMVIAHNKNGIVIQPNDSVAIEKAIEKYFSQSDFSSRMVENAFQSVNENFSCARMANQYMKIYDEC
ncbi:MAG: glycosyltransferase [Desulfopila sp.]